MLVTSCTTTPRLLTSHAVYFLINREHCVFFSQRALPLCILLYLWPWWTRRASHSTLPPLRRRRTTAGDLWRGHHLLLLVVAATIAMWNAFRWSVKDSDEDPLLEEEENDMMMMTGVAMRVRAEKDDVEVALVWRPRRKRSPWTPTQIPKSLYKLFD